jgi:hypothetical protein
MSLRLLHRGDGLYAAMIHVSREHVARNEQNAQPKLDAKSSEANSVFRGGAHQGALQPALSRGADWKCW